MTPLDQILIGIIVGFVLLAAVFRPNQVGGEGGRGLTIVLLVIVFAMGAYIYTERLAAKVVAEEAPQQEVPSEPEPAPLELPRNPDNFGDSFIDRVQDSTERARQLEEKRSEAYTPAEDDLYAQPLDEYEYADPLRYVGGSAVYTESSRTPTALPGRQSQPSYYLQLEALSTIDNAEQAKEELASGYPYDLHLGVLKQRTSGKAQFKVLLGPFDSGNAEAVRKRYQLKNWQVIEETKLYLIGP